MRRRSLPQLVVPVPCHVDWNTMTRIDSAGRARFCDSCERPVYNSAAITRDELLDLIARHEGRRLPCMRLHRRPDGTIVTRDCFAPLLRVGRFVWVQVALAATAFWVLLFGMRPLVRQLRESLNQTFDTVSSGDAVRGGPWLVTVEEDGPSFLDPDRLAPLPPGPPRPHAIPDPGWRPPLPAIDRVEPLHRIQADEGILNPPKRRPRYRWPEMR